MKIPAGESRTPGRAGEDGPGSPELSVIVLNRNGAEWLPRCLGSLQAQTIADRLEILVVDNASDDDSVALAERLLAGSPRARVIRSGGNLGYCGGNNLGARDAAGRCLLFLNNDTWLEPDCLERLIEGALAAGAAAAAPWVLNYADDTHQEAGFSGFDLFGLPSAAPAPRSGRTVPILVAGGCALYIETAAFREIGGFDESFFIYSEDADLSWRTWISGRRIVCVPAARLHHRGAAGVNPAGGETAREFRTSDRKRFLTNRNCLLTLLQNGQHALLLLAIPQAALLAAEALVGCLVLRRLSFARSTFLDVCRDLWRARGRIRSRRRRVRTFRRRSDFGMLRFLRLKPNRWFEVRRLIRFGLPRVDASPG